MVWLGHHARLEGVKTSVERMLDGLHTNEGFNRKDLFVARSDIKEIKAQITKDGERLAQLERELQNLLHSIDIVEANLDSAHPGNDTLTIAQHALLLAQTSAKNIHNALRNVEHDQDEIAS